MGVYWGVMWLLVNVWGCIGGYGVGKGYMGGFLAILGGYGVVRVCMGL